MKVELKAIALPTPPTEVVVTLSQQEALILKTILGSLYKDGHGNLTSNLKFTEERSIFYSNLYEELYELNNA